MKFEIVIRRVFDAESQEQADALLEFARSVFDGDGNVEIEVREIGCMHPDVDGHECGKAVVHPVGDRGLCEHHAEFYGEEVGYKR